MTARDIDVIKQHLMRAYGTLMAVTRGEPDDSSARTFDLTLAAVADAIEERSPKLADLVSVENFANVIKFVKKKGA